MEILFIAGFGPISREPVASRRFYADALGIAFEADGDYLHTGDLDGSRHFAVWPLEQAAESCYGTAEWPADVPVPQAWVEFDVTDVAAAAVELEAGGHRLVHGAKTGGPARRDRAHPLDARARLRRGLNGCGQAGISGLRTRRAGKRP